MGCNNCGGGSCWSGGPARDMSRQVAFVPTLPPTTDDQAPLPVVQFDSSGVRLDRRRIEARRREAIRKALGKA